MQYGWIMKKLTIVCLLVLFFLGLLFLFPASLVKTQTQNTENTQDNQRKKIDDEETKEQTEALNAAINEIVDRVEKNIQIKEKSGN